jgi:5'-3' exonuclease
LTYKNIASTTGAAETDLQIKIIMGDNSDNIPAIFPKCGPKTAKKCIDDPAFLLEKMSEIALKEIEQKEYYSNYSNHEKVLIGVSYCHLKMSGFKYKILPPDSGNMKILTNV